MIAVESLDTIRRTLAAAWAPPPRTTTAAWCTETLRMTDDSGTRRLRFSLAGRAWLRGILDALDDPDIEAVTIQGPAQIGKTTIAKAAIASRAAVGPCPMMFCGPDAAYVQEQARSIYNWADATPELADRLPPPHKRRARREINLGNCIAYLAWSGSPQTMSGRACRFVFCSELDRWTDDPRHGQSAELIAARVNSFPHSFKIVRESTPTDETSAIAAFYAESDGRRFLVPCPHCGHHQELRLAPHREGPHAGHGGIAGIQAADGTWLAPDVARRKAYYLCEQGCRIDNADKARMIDAGQWARHGETIDARGRVTGTPTRPGRHAGFHLSALYTVHSWGRIAAEYLRARLKNALRQFWNNWLGLPFTERRHVPKWRDLGRRLTGDHRRGTVPAAAWFLTAAADVQQFRVYWLIRAWGAELTSWLVDYGCCRRADDDTDDDQAAPASDLKQLEALIVRRRLAVAGVNPWGQAELPVALAGVDTNYRTRQVFAWLRTQPAGRVRALGGDPRPKPGRLFWNSIIEANARTGKKYDGATEKWWIDTTQLKEDVQTRWAIPPAADGAWLLPSTILSEPDGEDYLRQITNEALVVEVTPTGRRVKRWREIDSGRGNHWWDCEVYAQALAHMVTGGDFTAANLRQLAAAAQPKGRARPGPTAAGDDAGPDDFSAR